MTRYIEKSKVTYPVKKIQKRKNEISKPNSYNKQIMEATKPILTGRGKV